MKDDRLPGGSAGYQKSFMTLLGNIPLAAVMLDTNGDIIEINDYLLKLTGVERSETIGRSWFDLFVPPEIKERSKENFMNIVLRMGGQERYENELVTRNGARRTMAWKRTLVNGPDGDVECAVKIGMDVTDSMLAQEALMANEEKFRSVTSSAKDAIIMIDGQGQVTLWNHSAEVMFGYTCADAMGRMIHDLIIPERYRQAHIDGFSKFRTTGEGPVLGASVELEAVRKDGKEFPVELSLSRVWHGDSWGAVAFVHDITMRKRAEEKLKTAHVENEQLLATIPQALVRLDKDNVVTKWNRVAEKIFMIRAEEALGQRFYDLDTGWDWPQMRRLMDECAGALSTVRTKELKYKRANGKDGFISVSASTLSTDFDMVEGFLLLCSDTTEKRILEGQLTQAQKLESIGSLAAGIAHEINTPTQYVGDNIRFLQEAFDDIIEILKKYEKLLKATRDSAPDEIVKEVEASLEDADMEYLLESIPSAINSAWKGVQRVSGIVKAMKEFSHPGAKEKIPTDINRAIQSAVTVSRNEWKYVAELKTELDSSLPLVPCLPDEFNQVILNLITNASHAIASANGEGKDKKGLITITTGKDDDYAVIQISDTGCGVPDSIKDKIFDPFFTTKEVGKGTGQGLSITHSVITDKHDGTIFFTSEEGKGTTFTIRLPLHEEAGGKG